MRSANGAASWSRSEVPNGTRSWSTVAPTSRYSYDVERQERDPPAIAALQGALPSTCLAALICSAWSAGTHHAPIRLPGPACWRADAGGITRKGIISDSSRPNYTSVPIWSYRSLPFVTGVRAPEWRGSSGSDSTRHPPRRAAPLSPRRAAPRLARLRAAGGAVFGFGLHLRWFIASRLGLRVGHREVGVAARVEAPFRRQAQVAGRLPAQQGRQLLERDVA